VSRARAKRGEYPYGWMSAHDGAVAGRPARFLQPRYLVLSAAVFGGAAVGVLLALLHQSPRAVPAGPRAATAAAATWAAGARPAPDFSLTDQAGRPISLRRFRGGPVIVTFIDPLCRNLCPLEARILDRVQADASPAWRPAVVAVSVNQWGNARRYLRQDVVKWRLGAGWRWAVGAPGALKKVWRDYDIGVQDAPNTVAGVTVHQISHTEAAYVLDARGDERALFLYPFRAADVERALKKLVAAP
jgi:cytochrome oxidase Cu insertion factor (SCO1/SenC/PrrC family)